jgi:hypothetical protein
MLFSTQFVKVPTVGKPVLDRVGESNVIQTHITKVTSVRKNITVTRYCRPVLLVAAQSTLLPVPVVLVQ